MHDSQHCFCGPRDAWNDCCFSSVLRSSLPRHLVHVHGFGVPHHARAILVSKYNWNWHQCCQDVAVSSDGWSFSNGGEFLLVLLAGRHACILELTLFPPLILQISLTLNFFFFPISLIRVFLNRKISAPVGMLFVFICSSCIYLLVFADPLTFILLYSHRMDANVRPKR